MLIRVDAASEVPLYRQIVLQVHRLIASGKLKAGDRVPAVRELAVDIRINPNTVARAYRELQALGVFETVQGRGTFVTEVDDPQCEEARLAQYAALIADALDLAVGLRIDPVRAREVFEDLHRERFDESE